MMNGENKVIATYIRTATKDEAAVETKRIQIKDYTSELELDGYPLFILESVDLESSGLSTDRHGLNEILTVIKEMQVDLVLATDSLQFHHNRAEARRIIEEIEETGAIVDFTDEPELLEEGGLDSSKFLKSLSDTFAKDETIGISKRIKEGIKRSKNNK